MINYQKYLKVGLKVNSLVSEYLLKNLNKVKLMTHKEGLHYSLEEDQIANQMYVDYLKKYTPEISLYTEEGERNLGELTWVVDPIEGTSNYRVGNPFFASQITLLDDLKPVVAIVNAPFLKQLFTCIMGQGSYLNRRKLEISKIDNLKEALVVLGKGTDKKYNIWYAESVGKILPEVRTIRSFGACGLEMAYTAAGIIDVFVNNGSQFYDFVGGSLLIREAGGVVLNENGKDWKMENNFLLSSNQELAKKTLDIIRG